MDIKEIKDLMDRLEGSKLSKLSVKKGDFELLIEKAPPDFPPSRTRMVSREAESLLEDEVPLKGERGSLPRSDSSGSYVTSPMVGTYYSSPAPDQPPFVKVGDRVDENTVVCIIEAMKVMNEVKAGIGGTIAEILASHAEPVEFGTKILRIIP